MMNNVITSGLALVLVGLAGCVSPPAPDQSFKAELSDNCDTGIFAVSDAFVGARRGTCEILGSHEVRLNIEREDNAVKNPSPWYAFKVTAKEQSDVRITLDYGDWSHRYVPKISRDGVNFEVAPDTLYSVVGENQLQLDINANSDPMWISAQRFITPEDYETWLRTLATASDASLSIAGRSIADLPIYKFESGHDSDKMILFTGRQHPPEVSGAVAMIAFLNKVYGSSDLASRFREEFRIASLPLMNPDGVIAGHWRHNLGATDLNRDWGSFSQVETQVVKDLLDQMETDKVAVVAFIDFHSTNRNLFYTQAEPTEPEGFTAIWLARALARIRSDETIDYSFENEPRETSPRENGKNYMYKRYGIPSVTYEVGDETSDRNNTAAAGIFAEEFMRLALERL